MCSITGSFDSKTLRELVMFNWQRGQHSWSFSIFDLKEHHLTVSRGLGEININSIDIPDGYYGICHTQAPTTSRKDDTAIHPATGLFDVAPGPHALWHNGIIKDKCVKQLQAEFADPDNWDTALLLKKIIRDGTPDGVDGTFSCLWFRPYVYGKGDIVLFRNEISPLFVDAELNISSTRFDGSNPTPPNTILKMNFEERSLVEESTFKTVENPYYFIGV